MDFLDLLESLLPKASQWDSIGLVLGLAAGELETIRADSNGVEQCLRKVLQKWYGRSPHPTWEEIIAALKSPLVGDPALAQKLEDKMANPGIATGILKENMAKIKHSFATLVGKVTGKLEKRSQAIDMKRFRLHILTVFGDVIAGALSMPDIMASVSRHQLWDYSCCTPIEKIAEEFGGDDGELREWISSYKSELSGFKATTKIVDYIKVCNEEQDIADSSQSIKEDMKRFNRLYCRKLTFKLKSHVVGKSLGYIDELWRSIADHFLLPSLTSLLDSIHEGCMCVTWLVPTLSALQIQANIQDSADFLEQLEVVRVMMDHTILHIHQVDKDKHLPLATSSKLSESDMESLKRQVLTEELEMLVYNFAPQRYVPALQSRGILDRHDRETISNEVTTEDKVMKFVDILCEGRQGRDGTPAFDVLVEELVREGVHTYAARQLQIALERAVHVLETNRPEQSPSESECRQEHSLGMPKLSKIAMNRLKCNVLEGELPMLVYNISPQRYLPGLRSRGLLDRNESESINCEVTTQGKVDLFIEVLCLHKQAKDGTHAFDVLVEVMKEGVHTYAARQLEQALRKAVIEENLRLGSDSVSEFMSIQHPQDAEIVLSLLDVPVKSSPVPLKKSPSNTAGLKQKSDQMKIVEPPGHPDPELVFL